MLEMVSRWYKLTLSDHMQLSLVGDLAVRFIQVVDKSSKHDIVKYLRHQGYTVDCQASPEHFTLTVFNKEPS